MTDFSCILIGNEHLAVECGKQLLDAGHRIVAVVTRKPAIAEWAKSAGLDVLEGMQALAESEEQVDWLFSIANLDMIPDTILKRARSGAVNFHDGPLPRYAGLNAPVWTILNGETAHGVTWHLMQSGADTGDILVSRDLPVTEADTALTLNARCFAAGVESFGEVLSEIQAGLPGRRVQDKTQRTYYGAHRRPDGAARIDFAGSVEGICRLVRALDHGDYDNPVASPWIATAHGPVLVGRAEPAEGEGAHGQVLALEGGSAVIAAGGGAVRLSRFTDRMGASVEPGDFLVLGDLLPELSASDSVAFGPALSKAARNERHWRARFNDYQPAGWARLGQGKGERRAVPLDVPQGTDDDVVAAAFAAVIAAASGSRQCDLALSTGAARPEVVADWVPVRFDSRQNWGWAVARFRTECGAALEKSPFAADLPARIYGLPERRKPVAGISGGSQIDGLALTLVMDGKGARIEVETALISFEEARLIAARLSHLLAVLPELGGDVPVLQLPMLPDEERSLVIDGFNGSDVEFPRDLCIHRVFEAQVSRTPDATALIFEDNELTFARLNARANRLAHVLIGAGVGPGQPVGLHLRRTADLVVGALAILKAGGAYVPLDPTYPADRLAFYAADSKARVIISETALNGELEPKGVFRVLIDDDPLIEAAPETNPESAVTSADLAYLIYTSGSTGTPKGVMIEHRNVANFFTGMDARIAHGKNDVFLSVTSLSFDISVLELFWTLARGFKVVLLGEEKLVADGERARDLQGGMDFSLYYWGNDDGVGRDKYELLLEGAKFADENGFQAVWTPERHFHAFGGLYPNPSVTGAAVAAVTRNISVRAGSCVAPLHHSARIAEEWAVIDNLTNGKAGLALASGWHPDDFVLRPENSPPNNKAAVFDAIRDLRKLWSGDPLAMTRADGTTVEKLTQPRPVSKELPLWLTTAGNPESWRQAGEAGVHVLTHLLGQTIDEVADKIRIYHEALKASGRDPRDFSVTLMLHTYVAETLETAMEVAREPMKAYLKAAADLIKEYAWAFPAFKKPKGVATPRELDLGSLSAEELDDILEFAFLRYFETSGLFGTVDDALERVAEVKAIGVTEIACLVDYGIKRQTILDGLKLLAEVRAAANTGEGDGDYSIAAQIARHGVTHLQCTPYMARMLLENDQSRAALGRIGHMMIGGEPLPGALVRDLRKATRASLENMYGPTETTIWSTTGKVSEKDPLPSVGKPIANTRVYVLDPAMQPVGIGQSGEIWISGAGVARGYWQRATLTDEKFVEDPFHGGRMFGTGDLGRWRPDGSLDVLGRKDSQVKIRGYRIEIGEIEAAMEAVPGVTQAVAVVRGDASGVGQIHGYLTGSASETDLRTALAGKLPGYMVPTRIVKLERFPLTPNRKIDRNALPDPKMAGRPKPMDDAPEQGAKAAPPAGKKIEIDALAAIWAEILSVARVSPSDNFFDLGGHSLLAIEMHRRIKSELGVTGVSIADIFMAPTLGGLHGVIRKLQGGTTEVANAIPAVSQVVSAESTAAKRRELRSRRGAGS